MQEYPLITIALFGHYSIQQVTEALNVIFAQTYPELELIISLNDMDTPLDAVIRVLNAHHSENVKTIRINEAYEQTSVQEHLAYVCRHMSGESLMLFYDGCRFYDTEGLRQCIDSYGTSSFLIGTCVMYDINETYLGDIRITASDSQKDALHKIWREHGPVLLPESFVRSVSLWRIHSLDELENMIVEYLSQHAEHRFRICERLMFHCFVKDKHDYPGTVSDNGKSIALEQGKATWELNYADGKKAVKILENFMLHAEKCSDHLSNIEKLTEEIVLKEKHSVFGISSSNRAFIQILLRAKQIFLKKYFVKHRLNQLIKNVPFRKKIKAVFFVAEKYLWVSCYKSIYDLMAKRQDQYEIEVVYLASMITGGGQEQKTEWENWKDSDFAVQESDSYDFAASSPDLVFLCKPYETENEKWCAREIKHICPYIIYIPYNMALTGMYDFRKTLMFRLPVQYYAWKNLAWNKEYGQLYDTNAFHSTNKLEIGHPKFDVTEEMLSAKEKETIRMIKKQAAGRKVIFWNTSFVLGQDQPYGGIFLEYGLDFLKYITAADDFFLLWRPHPLFFQTLQQYSCYEQVMHMVNSLSDHQIYLDTEIAQWPAVFASDLLVSDSSGIIESYILTNKPIAVTTKGKVKIETHGVLCQVWDFNSLTDFLSELLTDGDLLSEARKKYVRDNYFMAETRTVAQRLLEVIEREFL